MTEERHDTGRAPADGPGAVPEQGAGLAERVRGVLAELQRLKDKGDSFDTCNAFHDAAALIAAALLLSVASEPVPDDADGRDEVDTPTPEQQSAVGDVGLAAGFRHKALELTDYGATISAGVWFEAAEIVTPYETRLAAVEARCAELTAQRDALADFKSFVHRRLDTAGIPTHPDGPHSAEGCRIGDRLDLVLADRQALADLRGALSPILADAERLNESIGQLRVKRTSRDSAASITRNAWKQTIIDLIRPRAQRMRDGLSALLAAATAGQGDDGGDAAERAVTEAGS